jgi:putative nucleotidyltransferase with HDIG domain
MLWRRQSKLATAVAALADAPSPGAEVAHGKKILREAHSKAVGLGDLAKLPPFQPVILKLLRLFDQEDVPTTEIARLIESDPTLSSELLVVVNSPLYALRSAVTSPAQAVSLLGYQATKSLVAALGMRFMMRSAPKTAVVRRVWVHSVAAATISQHFAWLFCVDPALAHVAGLLHDVGRLGLLAASPEEYGAFALSAQDSTAGILAAEERQFGMTHCQAGALLAKAWGLPETFCQAAGLHHEAVAQDDCLGLVHLGCQLANSFQFQAILQGDVLKAEETIAVSAPMRLRGQLLTGVKAASDAVLAALESLDF